MPADGSGLSASLTVGAGEVVQHRERSAGRDLENGSTRINIRVWTGRVWSSVGGDTVEISVGGLHQAAERSASICEVEGM